MAKSLEDFSRALPDGPFWVTGAFFKEFCDLLLADRARAGANLSELPSPKGRFFNAQAGGSTYTPTPDPWQVIASDSTPDPTSSAVLAQVYFDSQLFNGSLKVTDTVDGINTGQDFTIAAGDTIWLDIAIDNTVTVTGATIDSGESAWDGYDDPVSVNKDDPDNPYQDHYYQIIALVVDPTDERDGITLSSGDGTVSVKIVQRLRTHLIAAPWVVNGLPCLVAEAWQGPGDGSGS